MDTPQHPLIEPTDRPMWPRTASVRPARRIRRPNPRRARPNPAFFNGFLA